MLRKYFGKIIFMILFAGVFGFFSYSLASADPETPAEKGNGWEYPPVIQMTKYGTGMKIVVEPNILMDREKIPAIQEIRLLSDKGQFLGLKSFNVNDTKRRAEFLVEPSVSESGRVKLIVKSDADGDWSSEVPLEETPAQTTLYTTPPEPKADEISEAPEAGVSEVKDAETPAVQEPEKPIPIEESAKVNPSEKKKKAFLWW